MALQPPIEINPSLRLDENLRGLFVLGVQSKLMGLQTNAWGMVSESDHKNGKYDFSAGLIVLNAVMEEAPKVRSQLLSRGIGKRLLTLNQADVRESFLEMGEIHRDTPEEDRAKLLRLGFETLQHQPERYIDPHLVIGLRKIAKDSYKTTILKELGPDKQQKLIGLTDFMLAVQGLASTKRVSPYEPVYIPRPRIQTEIPIRLSS